MLVGLVLMSLLTVGHGPVIRGTLVGKSVLARSAVD